MRQNGHVTLCCGLAAGVFVAARLHGAMAEELAVDEIISFPNGPYAGLNDYMRQVLQRSPPVTPLYFILQYMWSQLVGTNVFLLRLLPLTLEAVASVGVALFARRQFGLPAFFLVLMLAFASSEHRYHSSDLRMYALSMLLVSAAMGTAWAYAGNGDAKWLAWNAVLNGLAIWSHLLCLAAFPVQFLFVLLYRREDRPALLLWLASLVVAAMGAIMWYTQIDIASTGKTSLWIPPPSWERVLGSLMWTCTYTPLIPQAWHWWCSPFLMVLLLLFFVRLHRTHRLAPRMRRLLVLLFMWLLLPNFLLAATPLVGTNAYAQRYYLSCCYAAMLLVAAGIALQPSRAIRTALAAGLAAFCAWQVVLSHQEPLRTQWTAASIPMTQRLQAGDFIAAMDGECRTCLAHYSGLTPRRIHQEPDHEKLLERVDHALAAGAKGWLMLRGDAVAMEEALQSRYNVDVFTLPGSMLKARLLCVRKGGGS